MIDRENVIKEFEHLLNAAKGNYQDFVDLTVDGGDEILALLKEHGGEAGMNDTYEKSWESYGDFELCKDCPYNPRSGGHDRMIEDAIKLLIRDGYHVVMKQDDR